MTHVPTLDLERLDSRERQTLSLLGMGYRDWEIAAKLSIKQQSEKDLLLAMIAKLGVEDRQQLAFYAFHHRL